MEAEISTHGWELLKGREGKEGDGRGDGRRESRPSRQNPALSGQRIGVGTGWPEASLREVQERKGKCLLTGSSETMVASTLRSGKMQTHALIHIRQVCPDVVRDSEQDYIWMVMVWLEGEDRVRKTEPSLVRAS